MSYSDSHGRRTLLVALWLGVALVTCLEPVRRTELEKTPHPCKEKYDDAVISEWVTEHLRGLPHAREVPQMLLLLGGSGAGKGTFIEKWKALAATDQGNHPVEDFVFHGLDEYLPYIPEYQQTIKDKQHVYKDAADACYKGAAIPAAKMAQKQMIAEKMDIIYEETGKNVKRIIENVLPPFIKARYRITVVLVHNDENIAITRAAGRFQKTGRYAPDDYIRGSFRNNLDTYKKLKDELHQEGEVSEAVYCDNSVEAIRCWRDGSITGQHLVPDKMLLEGRPTYLGVSQEL